MLILNVIDASCYWVRILDHRPTDANQTSSQIADSTEFLELTMAVSGWYADPNHRVKQELVDVGDLCAVKLENSNSFHRYSTTRNMTSTEKNNDFKYQKQANQTLCSVRFVGYQLEVYEGKLTSVANLEKLFQIHRGSYTCKLPLLTLSSCLPTQLNSFFQK